MEPEEEKPLWRGHSHQAMFFVSLGACVPLILRSEDAQERLATIVYSIGLLGMFGMSSLYHRVNWSGELEGLFKKLDHAAIFLMIAGSFTAASLLGLSPGSSRTLLFTIWSVTILGIVQAIFFVNLPNMITSAIYHVAGYLVLPYLSELRSSIGPLNFALILAGGLSYTIGAICYGLRRPILSPKVFGYHEVFHLFVNTGAILHFVVVSSLIE